MALTIPMGSSSTSVASIPPVGLTGLKAMAALLEQVSHLSMRGSVTA